MLRATWNHFASTTTVGGIVQLYNAPHILLKAAWFLIFLTFTGLTAYNSYTVFLDYYNYPVLTYVSISYERSVPFPAVTVCNLNPMPCSNIALGYMANPATLQKLFDLSNCRKTIGRPPLLYKLISGDKVVPNFVPRLRTEMIDAILREIQTQKQVQSNQGAQQGGSGPAPSGQGQAGGQTPVYTNETLQMNSTSDLINFFLPASDQTNPPLPKSVPMRTLEDIVNRIIDSYNPLANSPTPPSTSNTAANTPTGGAPPPPRAGQGGVGPRDISSAKDEYVKAESFLVELLSMFRGTATNQLIKGTGAVFNQFIMDCTFQGADCFNGSFFRANPNPSYGRCFTFNSAFNPNDGGAGKRVVGMTGKLYGLTLDLFIGQADYLPNSISSSEGIRIVIHDPNEGPNPEDEGISLRPNTETDIALKMVTVSRLESPYQSQCINDWDATPFSPFKENDTEVTETYSYGTCQHMCETMHILRECKCMDPHTFKKFTYNGARIGDTERLCIVSKEAPADFNCKASVRRDLQAGTLTCDCSLPCDDNIYESHISSATWPSNGYLETVAGNYLGKYSNLSSSELNLTPEKMKNIVKAEFARVNIYFRTLNLETVEEQAKYDIWGFLSSLGGAVGLYLGMCGISLIEIFELAILLIIAGVCKKQLVQSDETEPARTVQVNGNEANQSTSINKEEELQKELFRMTKSAELLRRNNVYPIKVPEVDQSRDFSPRSSKRPAHFEF